MALKNVDFEDTFPQYTPNTLSCGTVFSKENIKIEIPLEEYKELLIIKGKYEELKSMSVYPWNPTTITWKQTGWELPEYPYKVTCDNDNISSSITHLSGKSSTWTTNTDYNTWKGEDKK